MAKKQIKKISIPFMGNDGLTIKHKEIFYEEFNDDNFPLIQKMKAKKILKVRNEITNKHSKTKRNTEII